MKMVTLKVDSRLLAAYLFYGGILLLKMLLMSLMSPSQGGVHVPKIP